MQHVSTFCIFFPNFTRASSPDGDDRQENNKIKVPWSTIRAHFVISLLYDLLYQKFRLIPGFELPGRENNFY